MTSNIIKEQNKNFSPTISLSKIKWLELRNQLILLHKSDPELELIQVNLLIRNLHPKPQNKGLLNFNFL